MEANFREHILTSYDLSPKDFDRLMEEINGYYGMTLEEYIQHRHFQLHREGMKNPEIYSLLKEEIRDIRFSVHDISERRIRRIIYG